MKSLWKLVVIVTAFVVLLGATASAATSAQWNVSGGASNSNFWTVEESGDEIDLDLGNVLKCFNPPIEAGEGQSSAYANYDTWTIAADGYLTSTTPVEVHRQVLSDIGTFNGTYDETPVGMYVEAVNDNTEIIGVAACFTEQIESDEETEYCDEFDCYYEPGYIDGERRWVMLDGDSWQLDFSTEVDGRLSAVVVIYITNADA